MSLPAAIECGDALIVFEGPRRIRHRTPEPLDLWPDAREAEDVRARIEHGRPILVILGGPQAEATLLSERFAEAPPALARFAHAIARELAPLPVPALDWLPHDLRDHGLRFLRASVSHARRTPALLRPALSLDDRAAAWPHVRFAHLSGTGATAHELSPVVAYAFADLTPPRLTR
ncbi:hypothetical protein DVA67_020310 [Solirubrobacter sp. CPCC 204708]|uniref:Uncharacterized protein n=1 Tax=Solirubrobacter deserti TaxID=2282478 RepID=A0ABT4RTZ8_9ACTN|nr:hypothetical protein [Solirubrobacter deserti]MBE2318337.1 hypothetical protein [Solirubrobacter deserti]MDA0141935.1 hypothetical protein [Solirubrobacter deserti]